MFTHSITIRPRLRSLWLATLLGLFAGGAAAASAQASPASPVASEAVIASANGTTIDTTSGSSPVAAASSRSASSGTLTLNSSGATTVSPTSAPPAKTPSASQIGAANLESPIVGSTSRHEYAPPVRTTLAQLQADGPIVAASGAVTVAKHRTAAAGPTRAATFRGAAPTYKPKAPIAASSTVEINTAGVHVYINPTIARRPSTADTRGNAAGQSPARTAGSVGAPGSGFAGLLPDDPRPAPTPGGPANPGLFGAASGSAGGIALLGIDVLLTAAVLLAGAQWRRRSWDLPVLARQSALLSLALDRPG
jgi:hypothetical protein